MSNTGEPPGATPLQRMKVLAHEFLCMNIFRWKDCCGKICKGTRWNDIVQGFWREVCFFPDVYGGNQLRILGQFRDVGSFELTYESFIQDLLKIPFERHLLSIHLDTFSMFRTLRDIHLHPIFHSSTVMCFTKIFGVWTLLLLHFRLQVPSPLQVFSHVCCPSGWWLPVANPTVLSWLALLRGWMKSKYLGSMVEKSLESVMYDSAVEMVKENRKLWISVVNVCKWVNCGRCRWILFSKCHEYEE